MSSSYGTSINQSTESGTSSLLRSGLNISVGDTKSIVLALQALQQKIRALEQDRDFHQSQYDRALQAHEAYKLDMERQADKERADHRRREQELMELLRKAREEKVKLESAVNGSQDDLSAFREELEKLIATEKEQAQQREGALRGEIARLRQEVEEERTKYATLTANLERLRAEREAAYDTNEQLRAAMADLERLRRETAAATAAASSSHPSQRRAGRGLAQRGRRGPSPAMSPAAHGRLREAAHKTYRDPTCSSRLRDVRTHEGEVSCVCEASTLATAASPAAAMNRVSPASRSASATGPRTRPAPVSPSSVSRYDRNSPARPSHPTARTSSPSAAAVSTAAPTPIAVVEDQLREELADLQREYKNTIDRASAENLPRHVVNTALERISELIDKKEAQLQLMQAARREATHGSSQREAGSGSPSKAPGGYTSAGVVSDKATQRALLVNELRSMLAEGSKQQ